MNYLLFIVKDQEFECLENPKLSLFRFLRKEAKVTVENWEGYYLHNRDRENFKIIKINLASLRKSPWSSFFDLNWQPNDLEQSEQVRQLATFLSVYTKVDKEDLSKHDIYLWIHWGGDQWRTIDEYVQDFCKKHFDYVNYRTISSQDTEGYQQLKAAKSVSDVKELIPKIQKETTLKQFKVILENSYDDMSMRQQLQRIKDVAEELKEANQLFSKERMEQIKELIKNMVSVIDEEIKELG